MTTTASPHELVEIAVYIGGVLFVLSFIAMASDAWLASKAQSRRWHR